MKKRSFKLASILCAVCVICGLAMLCSGCGLLSYTPQERDIKTSLNLFGCSWTWESTARGWQPAPGEGKSVDAAAAAEAARKAVLEAKSAK